MLRLLLIFCLAAAHVLNYQLTEENAEPTNKVISNLANDELSLFNPLVSSEVLVLSVSMPKANKKQLANWDTKMNMHSKKSCCTDNSCVHKDESESVPPSSAYRVI